MSVSKSPDAGFSPGVQEIVRPLVTVDVVIFTVGKSAEEHDCLQVLLVRRPGTDGEPFAGHWALPGGFVDVVLDADLRSCALRKLREKTSVETPYLEQLGSWGGRLRDPRGWSATHVYFALLPLQGLNPRKGGNAEELGWFPIDRDGNLPSSQSMAFDHAEILAAAIERLRSKVEYTSLPAFLLSEPFTLPQLQRIYEVVLGRPLDKSSFRTRVLAMDFLEEAGQMLHIDVPRKPEGYRVKKPLSLVTFPRPLQTRSSHQT